MLIGLFLFLTACLSPAGFDPFVFENSWWELQEYPACFNFHETGSFLVYENYITNEGPWYFEEPNAYYIQDEQLEVFYKEECWEIRGYKNLNLTACECVILPRE